VLRISDIEQARAKLATSKRPYVFLSAGRGEGWHIEVYARSASAKKQYKRIVNGRTVTKRFTLGKVETYDDLRKMYAFAKRFQPPPDAFRPKLKVDELPGVRPSLDRLLEEMIIHEKLEEKLAERSVRALRDAMQRFKWKDEPVDRLPPWKEVSRWHSEHPHHNGINKTLNLCKRIWKWAEECEDLPYRWDKISTHPENNEGTPAIPPSELPELLRRIDKLPPHQRTFWFLTSRTGLRHSEVLSLRYEDVDIDNAIITVSKPKGGKTRRFSRPIGKSVVAYLHQLQENGGGGPWVCASPKSPGRPRHEVRLKGFPNPHRLRSTYITLLLEGGVSELIVAKLVNHTLPKGKSVTIRYADPRYFDARAAVEMVDKVLSDMIFFSGSHVAKTLS
jgi:integrase